MQLLSITFPEIKLKKEFVVEGYQIQYRENLMHHIIDSINESKFIEFSTGINIKLLRDTQMPTSPGVVLPSFTEFILFTNVNIKSLGIKKDIASVLILTYPLDIIPCHELYPLEHYCDIKDDIIIEFFEKIENIWKNIHKGFIKPFETD